VVPDPHLQLAFTVFGGYNPDLQGCEVNKLADIPFLFVDITCHHAIRVFSPAFQRPSHPKQKIDLGLTGSGLFI
jgi:hypothetical protein